MCYEFLSLEKCYAFYERTKSILHTSLLALWTTYGKDLLFLYICLRACKCVIVSVCVHIDETWPLNVISSDVSKKFRICFTIFPPLHIGSPTKKKRYSDFRAATLCIYKVFILLQNTLIRFGSCCENNHTTGINFITRQREFFTT